MTVAKKLIYILLMDKSLGEGLTQDELYAHLNKVSKMGHISTDRLTAELSDMVVHKNIYLDGKLYKVTRPGLVMYDMIANSEIGKFLISNVNSVLHSNEKAQSKLVSESK